MEKIKDFGFRVSEQIYGQSSALLNLKKSMIAHLKFNSDNKPLVLMFYGPSGVGKTMYTKKYLLQKSEKEKVPNDWCYIYNFENPNEPVAVSFPAGQGKVFKETMDSFIKDIKKDIKKTFNNDDFEKEKKSKSCKEGTGTLGQLG